MKRLLLFLALLAPFASATTPQTVTISSQGSVIRVGTTLNLTVLCHYPGGSPADDNCAAAGGATWFSPTAAFQSGNGGTFAAGSMKWSATWDPHNTTDFPNGAQTAIGLVRVTAGGVSSQPAYFLAQSLSDTFEIFVTPWADFYQDSQSHGLLQPNLVQGSTMAVGVGFTINQNGSGNPFQFACNWTSSNNAIATVDPISGLATAGTTNGNVTITCTPSGNGVYDTALSGHNDFYGHPVGATGSTAAWEFTVVNPTATLVNWFVGTDGGTPFVSSGATPFGQCTGKTDAAYSGTTNARWHPLTAYTTGIVITANNGHYQTATTGGTSGTVSGASEPTWGGTTTTDGSVTWTAGATYPVNQACRLGNFSYLYYDQVTVSHDAWMIGPGDTVLVHNPVSGFYAGGYLANNDTQNPGLTGTAGAIQPINCPDSDCYMPTIPSGTAAHPTMILGENFASCAADSARTPILGSWGGKKAINLHGSQNVIIECIKVSNTSQCGDNGAFGSNACTKTAVAAKSNWSEEAIEFSAMTSNVILQNVWSYGNARDGLFGATGAGVQVINSHIQGNPANGYNGDDAPYGGMSNISVAGGMNMTGTLTEFSGCVAEKPQVHTFPYVACADQSLGGTGDGFATASTTGAFSFDHDIWRYNLQDGLDLLHSNMQTLNVTNSQSYGNIGNMYKIGAADNSVLFQNNTALANCERLDQVVGDEPSSGVPVGANFCRAGGGPLVMHFNAFGTYIVNQNTINGYGDTSVTYGCESGSENCSTATTSFLNNALLSWGNTSFTSQQSATFCALDPSTVDCNHFLSNYPANQGWGTRSNNIYYQTRACPASLVTAETCNTSSPLFASQPGSANITFATETTLDGFQSPQPASTSSPLYHGGTNYTGSPSTDLFGTASTSPLVKGAINLPTGAPTLVSTAVTPNPGAVTVGSTLAMTCTATFSDSTTPPCTSPVWTDTAAHSSVNSSTGVVTGASAGSDTVTATIGGISGGATVNVSAAPPSTGLVVIGITLRVPIL